MFKKLFYLLLLCFLFSMVVACNQSKEDATIEQPAPESAMIGGYPRDSIMAIMNAVPLATEKDATEARESCCDPICPNNFSVSVVPFNKATCQCLKGYIAFNYPGCPDTTNLTRSVTNGIYSAYTGFNNVCSGSNLVLCLDSYHLGSPFCETDCFSGLILISSVGVPLQQLPFCFDVSNGPVCLSLGNISCCQTNNSNCKWTTNPSYLAGVETCTPCGTAYNCDN